MRCRIRPSGLSRLGLTTRFRVWVYCRCRFDYAQQIEEQYTITVSAPNSIAAVGTLPDKLQGRFGRRHPQVVAAENSMTLYRNDVSGIPPMDLV